MTVNGRPRWTCRSHVKRVAPDGRLTIEPLRNLPRIKDLACDLTAFFEKWHRAEGRFAGDRTRHEEIAPVVPDSPDRQAVDAAIECINCAVCYSACDVVAWQPDYLGPAALNRAWSLLKDERHVESDRLRAAVARPGGCHGCHSQGSCEAHCPVGISPTKAISGLKRLALADLLRGRRW